MDSPEAAGVLPCRKALLRAWEDAVFSSFFEVEKILAVGTTQKVAGHMISFTPSFFGLCE